MPWLVWLSWLHHCPVTARSQVWSPVWMCMGGNQSKFLSRVHVSLSLSLSLPLFKTKQTKKKNSVKMSSGEAKIIYIWGWTPKSPEFIYKKLCIYSYMFELQSLPKYSPFDATHLLRHFSHCSKQFLNLSILMPFSASAIVCFTSSTLAKHFPLRTFFIRGNKKTSHSGRDPGNRAWGAWGSCCFWSKTAEYSVWWRQVCL